MFFALHPQRANLGVRPASSPHREIVPLSDAIRLMTTTRVSGSGFVLHSLPPCGRPQFISPALVPRFAAPLHLPVLRSIDRCLRELSARISASSLRDTPHVQGLPCLPSALAISVSMATMEMLNLCQSPKGGRLQGALVPGSTPFSSSTS